MMYMPWVITPVSVPPKPMVPQSQALEVAFDHHGAVAKGFNVYIQTNLFETAKLLNHKGDHAGGNR